MDQNGKENSEKTNIKLLAFQHKDMVIGQDDELELEQSFNIVLFSD